MREPIENDMLHTTGAEVQTVHLVGILDAATIAIVILAPPLVPHIVAFFAPFVSKLVGAAQAPVLLTPPLFPLFALHDGNIA